MTTKELIELLQQRGDLPVLVDCGDHEPREIKYVEHIRNDKELPDCVIIHPTDKTPK